jgi:hypothetical protein
LSKVASGDFHGEDEIKDQVLIPSIAVFFARTRFRLRRSENENDDENDDEDDSSLHQSQILRDL